MGTGYRNWEKGISLVPNSTTQNSTPGDLETLTSDNRLHLFGATTNDAVTTDAVTATLTNKSMDGGSNTFTNIPAGALPSNLVTTTGTQTLTNKTLTAPIIATIANGAATLTLPSTSDTIVGRATTDTLTNKTLTAPVIATISNGGTITLPTATTTLVGTNTTDTLLNKTLSSALFDTLTGETGIPALVQSAAGQQLQLNAGTASSVHLQVGGTDALIVGSTSVLLASGSSLILTNNGQTVALKSSATATATYAVIFPDAAPTASTALVYNGTNYVWSQAGGWSTANASITSGGTFTLGTGGQQLFIAGGSGGAQTTSTTPFGTSAPTDGTVLRVICNSDTNNITFTNNDATNGAILNGPATLYHYYMIEFQYSSTLSRYIETTRNF